MRWRGTVAASILVTGLVGAGCLYAPDIIGPPEELDQPPIVSGVSPNPNSVITLDREQGETVRLTVTELSDINLNDQLDFQFALVTRVFDEPFPTGGTFEGFLAPLVDQPDPNRTFYDTEPISLEFDPCATDNQFLFPDNSATVQLEIRDEIPISQQEKLNAEAHLVTLRWAIEIQGDASVCP